MPEPQPDALLSDTRFDNQHHQQYLTTFRAQLSGSEAILRTEVADD